MSAQSDLEYLRRAIVVSQAARDHGNHPFGAVLVAPSGAIVLEAENSVTTENDVTNHAETNLVRLASRTIRHDDLPRYTCYTSCEPCAMCAGAIVHARIARLYYGAGDVKGGAVEHGARVFDQPQCLHRPEVYAGIGAEPAGALLRDFFRARR